MFITFEGIDASGKSTQVRLLEKYFIDNGEKVLVVREPGGTRVSEEIRNILLSRKNLEMVKECELFLFCASRTQLVNELILPKLKEGYVVISDRFHDSTKAYQGFGRVISSEEIEVLLRVAIRECVPDLTFFMDIDFDEAQRRQLKNQTKKDRIEIMNEDFFNRVRQGYKKLIEQEPDRIKLIDGTQPIELIHKQIIDIVNTKYKKG